MQMDVDKIAVEIKSFRSQMFFYLFLTGFIYWFIFNLLHVKGTIAEELDAEKKIQSYLVKKEEVAVESADPPVPLNYFTCYEFFKLWFQDKLGLFQRPSKNEGNEERTTMTDEHHKICIPPQCPKSETPLVPPNYDTIGYFAKLVFMFALVLAKVGIRIIGINQMKKKHVWGNQLLKALMKTPTESYMGSGDQPPGLEDIRDFVIPGPRFESHLNSGDDGQIIIQELQKKVERLEKENKKTAVDPELDKMDTKETVFLIAAKNGIVEMVKVILEKIPSALHETTIEKKRNVFHVAIKNRQPLVVKELLKTLNKQDKNNLIQELDKDDNTVLHLAAETLGNETPQKIPGSAMQMMWDITWFQYIKSKVPEHFVFRRNRRNETSEEIFKASHKALVKESGEWLKDTSESCSVVAALIAGVSFATASQVPGGTENGRPVLEDEPEFEAFAMSSLIGLCFSVTALMMFLSILTSRKETQDFRRNLPLKLLLGLTSLFVSIIALFVSFCTGHFFVLKNQYRQYVFPIYISTCLPVSFYAVAQFPLYLDLLQATLRKEPLPSV